MDTFVDTVLDGNPLYSGDGCEKISRRTHEVSEAPVYFRMSPRDDVEVNMKSDPSKNKKMAVPSKMEMKHLSFEFSRLHSNAMRCMNLWYDDDQDEEFAAVKKAEDDLMQAWDIIFQSIIGRDDPEHSMCSLNVAMLNMKTIRTAMRELSKCYEKFLVEDFKRHKDQLKKEVESRNARCAGSKHREAQQPNESVCDELPENAHDVHENMIENSVSDCEVLSQSHIVDVDNTENYVAGCKDTLQSHAGSDDATVDKGKILIVDDERGEASEAVPMWHGEECDQAEVQNPCDPQKLGEDVQEVNEKYDIEHKLQVKSDDECSVDIEEDTDASCTEDDICEEHDLNSNLTEIQCMTCDVLGTDKIEVDSDDTTEIHLDESTTTVDVHSVTSSDSIENDLKSDLAKFDVSKYIQDEVINPAIMLLLDAKRADPVDNFPPDPGGEHYLG